MLAINETLFNELKEHFSKRKFGEPYFDSGTWQTHRFIKILTPLVNDLNIHYEYRIKSNWEGSIELHFEGDDWAEKYGKSIDELCNRTQDNPDLSWTDWMNGRAYRCKYENEINDSRDLIEGLTTFMGIFDHLLMEVIQPSKEKHTKLKIVDTINFADDETVGIQIMKLRDVLSLPLSIPVYQRIYCWEETNVRCLLNDVFEHIDNQKNKDVPYRLGTIILHANKGKYDIIDGQQRLITLSLILNELNIDTKLLEEKLYSKKSIEYAAYNKYVINSFIKRKAHNKSVQSNALLDNIDFCVLLLKNNDNLDLAYTFFSNQNSRGVDLSDYDLLKAHHLRYIPQVFEQQSTRAAQVWNKMIEEGRSQTTETEQPDYVNTLDTYIYRLRKWMRKKDCLDDFADYRIKQEYEAAPVIEEIPPFGERFYFNEPIQGGTHFFSFVEQHLDTYHQFVQTDQYKLLHHAMSYGSHRWYRDVIEGLLFGYYLKFDSFYLSDALVVIMRIILQHRYDNKRSQKSAIIKYASGTELVLIIDQATSPTFFLAEARNIAKELEYPLRQDMYPIQLKMRSIAVYISDKMEKDIVTNSFKKLNR